MRYGRPSSCADESVLIRSDALEGMWGARVTSGVLSRLGFAGLAGQTTLGYFAVANYHLNGPGENAVSPDKALTTFGFGGASIALRGPPGLALGVGYTLVDSLYPRGSHEGGFEAWKADYSASTNRMWRWQQMNLWPTTASQSDRLLWKLKRP